jgi:hypothetical protein
MMRKSYPWLWLLVGVLAGLIVSSRFALLAQDRSEATRSDRDRSSRAGSSEGSGARVAAPAPVAQPAAAPAGASSSPTVHDVLSRPYRFPFAGATSLVQVCAHLRESLKVPIVLDQAALDRQGVEPEDTVQLELDGVRLKTGLKILLDQVGLTYHAIDEDNLLVITDREGSEDPLDRIWAELRALHRDLHDVQDAVDDLTELVGGEPGDGPRVRKPTIIEELPEKDGEKPEKGDAKPEAAPEKPAGPGRKPNGALRPTPAPRSTPARVPLHGARRRL